MDLLECFLEPEGALFHRVFAAQGLVPEPVHIDHFEALPYHRGLVFGVLWRIEKGISP